MFTYRIANSEAGLPTGAEVEAENPAEAAAQYVAENNMQTGRWFVQRVIDHVEVDVSGSTTIHAEVVGGDDTAEATA